MPKVLTGTIVSLNMQNTVVVEVVWKSPHPMYKKLLQKSKKYKAAINGKEVKVGDRVKMIETKKFSRGKYFAISEVFRSRIGDK
ncbi:MAG: 30S ribosomal protein S17 [Candidatus Levybacteria bacterium]|nr:30S ribosomal protein S17 [Candidatus Levybacteria bacterium]